MQPPELVDATLECAGGVAELTLRRDDVRNALTGTALVDDIVRAVEWANASPAVSVLILTGAGSAFCAGGNVKEMRDRQGIFAGSALAIQDQYRRGIQRLPLALAQAEIPLIAAVNGPAIGAGCDLACMCDMRLGSTAARFGETFLNLGIIPGGAGAGGADRRPAAAGAAPDQAAAQGRPAHRAPRFSRPLRRLPGDGAPDRGPRRGGRRSPREEARPLHRTLTRC